jgi:hypothetical protein
MLEYSVSQTPDEQFVITLLEGSYKGVVVKIVDLAIEEDGFPSFEMELPSSKTELFKDDDFINEVQLIVGDILKKSIDFIWNTQEDLIQIETRTQEILKNKRIPYDLGDSTIVEKSMLNGYVLVLKGDTVVANKMSDNSELDLSNDSDVETFRRNVLSSIILN